MFASTPNGSTNRFAQQLNKIRSPKPAANLSRSSPSPAKNVSKKLQIFSPKPVPPPVESQDSGYYGSQDVASQNALRQSFRASLPLESQDVLAETATETTSVPLRDDTPRNALDSPEKTFQTAKEDQTARVQASTAAPTEALAESETGPEDDAREENERDTPTSPQSEGSSPIRPVVRKSSLNFASLPAREPLTAVKNTAARVSRTSHLDHNRTSHYGRATGGKSLGNHPWRDSDEDEGDDHNNQDEMDVDKQPVVEPPSNPVLNHNRTYTQRLQDQINQLGKQSNGSRPSKSIPNIAALQQNAVTNQLANPPRSSSPKRVSPTKSTPGAFPEDDDDWIEPPAPVVEEVTNTRPALPKSHSADVMEGIHRDQAGAEDLVSPAEKPGQSTSPIRGHGLPANPLGHSKAASVSTIALSSQKLDDQMLPLTKATTISNPFAMSAITESGAPQTPSKSPSRGFRDSPLKQVKNKLSSILKSSRGLLASSAAISAEGKTSILSPSTSRLAHHTGPSTDTIMTKPSSETSRLDGQFGAANESTVTLPVAKRTRASVEREKAEKRRDKEAKRMEEQMDKLEKAREQEREKARVFSKEQERIAAMEKQVASKNADAKLPIKETPKPIRSSPRKQNKDQDEVNSRLPPAEDIEMTDAPVLKPPPTIPRSNAPAPAPRGKEIKRPVKPTKDTQTKAKQVPTVIRVNTVSQSSQYHPPAGSAPTTAVPETPSHLTSQIQPGTSKASKASLQKKPSTQSLKGSTSISRPKALDLAAKKKEQDEKEAQRRREAKAELERKRAAAQEEQRRQDQQRLELERQKQKDREQAAAQAEAKQRQAMIEKAKQTRAPPAATRAQPNGPPDYSNLPSDKLGSSQSRPPSRMTAGVQRPHEDSSRPVNAVLSNASKAGMKRTLGVDASSDAQGQRPPSRAGPQYQAKDAKRRRTSQEHNDPIGDNPPNIKGPPVRPSAGFRKVSKAIQTLARGNAMQALTARRSYQRSRFISLATPRHHLPQRGSCSRPLSLPSTTATRRPHIPWTWPRFQRAPFHSPRIRTLLEPKLAMHARPLLVVPSRWPSLCSRSLRLDTRMENTLIFLRSTRTMRMRMTRMNRRLWV